MTYRLAVALAGALLLTSMTACSHSDNTAASESAAPEASATEQVTTSPEAAASESSTPEESASPTASVSPTIPAEPTGLRAGWEKMYERTESGPEGELLVHR